MAKAKDLPLVNNPLDEAIGSSRNTLRGVDAIYYIKHNGEPAYYVSVKGGRNTMHGFIVTSIDYDGWGYPLPDNIIETTPNVPADAILVWDQDFPLS